MEKHASNDNYPLRTMGLVKSKRNILTVATVSKEHLQLNFLKNTCHPSHACKQHGKYDHDRRLENKIN